MDEKKMLAAVEDRAFLEKIVGMDSVEDVQAAFKKDKGIEISAEDLEAIQKVVEEKMDGELSEDDLENVAGGIAVTTAVAVGTIVVGGLVELSSAVSKWTRRRW